ncbi:hypothetical protein [Tianweitania sp.]|uniref:hypothetical protein n=1 Tax=Tianweitania sp. TaxID=2021634 RepID=UPI0028976C28|nr:hypothetical protein [Tianweitania sp.]
MVMIAGSDDRPLPSIFVAYILDGFRAFPRPVTTISGAAERYLSHGQLTLVALGFLVLAILIGIAPPLLAPYAGSLDSVPSGFVDFSRSTQVFIGVLSALPLLLLFVSLIILFFIGVVLGGKASFRRFGSAGMVLAGVWLVGHFFQLVLFGSALLVPDSALLALIRLALPLVLAVILISFSVLTVRYGLQLDQLRSFAAVMILLALSAAESFIMGGRVFGTLSATGQLI